MYFFLFCLKNHTQIRAFIYMDSLCERHLLPFSSLFLLINFIFCFCIGPTILFMHIHQIILYCFTSKCIAMIWTHNYVFAVKCRCLFMDKTLVIRSLIISPTHYFGKAVSVSVYQAICTYVYKHICLICTSMVCFPKAFQLDKTKYDTQKKKINRPLLIRLCKNKWCCFLSQFSSHSQQLHLDTNIIHTTSRKIIYLLVPMCIKYPFTFRSCLFIVYCKYCENSN